MDTKLREMLEAAISEIDDADFVNFKEATTPEETVKMHFLASIAKSLAVLAANAIEEPPVPVYVSPTVFRDEDGNEIKVETLLPDLSGPPGSINIAGTLDLGVPLGESSISAAPPGAFGVAQTGGINLSEPFPNGLTGKADIGEEGGVEKSYEFDGPVELIQMRMPGGGQLTFEGKGFISIKGGKAVVRVHGDLLRKKEEEQEPEG